jgi:hypothetical protein
MKQFALAFLAIIFVSCATKSDFIPYQVQYLPEAEFYLRELTLESIFSYDNIQDQLKNMIQSLGKKYGLTVNLTQAPGSLPLDITIRDKSFVSGFDTLHSLAVVLEAYDSAGAPLARYYYAEDSRTPLDSFFLIFSLMDKNFQSFAESFQLSYQTAPAPSQ